MNLISKNNIKKEFIDILVKIKEALENSNLPGNNAF